MQLPVRPRHRGQHFGRRFGLGQIYGDDGRAADLAGERVEPFLAACHEHELRARLTRQPARRRLADAARRAGHDGYEWIRHGAGKATRAGP